jgi:hypothetical protein
MKTNPTINHFGRTALLLLSLMAAIVLVVSITSCSKSTAMSPLAFGGLAMPKSTNADYASLAITNQSDSVVFYLACPPQVMSNGIWSGPANPSHQKLTKLAARQAGIIVVDAGWTNENTRVPVLWGYDYTPGATRWQEFREGLVRRVRGRGGRGFLYTNYLTSAKP